MNCPAGTGGDWWFLGGETDFLCGRGYALLLLNIFAEKILSFFDKICVFI